MSYFLALEWRDSYDWQQDLANWAGITFGGDCDWDGVFYELECAGGGNCSGADSGSYEFGKARGGIAGK
jgi:hypothetical protein